MKYMYVDKALGIYIPEDTIDETHYHEYIDGKCECGDVL